MVFSYYNTLFILFTFLSFSCNNQDKSSIANPTLDTIPNQIIDPTGTTIKSRIKTPKGFNRMELKKGTFANYLSTLPLKPHGTAVSYYDGSIKPKSRNVYCAVLDMDIGNNDLHQCADAVMRLRAEYLYLSNQHDQIQFNFTNGMPVPYSKWKAGYRINVNHNETNWVLSANESDSYDTFWKYLETIFMYAGTYSLAKEMKSKAIENIQIGDVFIQGGFPGHAIIVVDMAIHTETKERIMLLAQSYMPAQELQILNNPNNDSGNPWYFVKSGVLNTPEWTFDSKDLKHF